VIELLIATTNPGKFAEVRDFLRDLPLRLISLRELANPPVVIEDGESFEANALKKARTLAQFSGKMTLADDSGIEVDALDGAPGIHSARYAGPECDDGANNAKLLGALTNVPAAKRTARFVCALALCAPAGAGLREWTVRQSCEGKIAFAPKGNQGFGYDPLFCYPPLGKTFGQIDRHTKAGVSHRGKALGEFAKLLPLWINFTANRPRQT